MFRFSKIVMFLCIAFSTAAALASSQGGNGVALKTRLADGSFLVLCENGSLENNVTGLQIFTGDVCPTSSSKGAATMDLKRSIVVGSCVPFEVNLNDRYEVIFHADARLEHNGKQDTIDCLMEPEYSIPIGYRLTYQTVEIEFKDVSISESSEFILLLRGMLDSKAKIKLPKMKAKNKTQNFKLETPSSTPCVKSAAQRVKPQIYTVLGRFESTEGDSVSIYRVKLPDLRLEKC